MFEQLPPTLSVHGRGNAVPNRRALPPFAALRAFDAVARLGGVRRAALELELDHAVVSRHLRSLEQWTGIPLIERSRGRAMLTREGERYHGRISDAIDGIAHATIDLMRLGDDIRLHIWCMPGFAFQWLISRLDEFQNANPQLDMELRPTDAGPDFNQHEADVDIRYAAVYGPALSLQPCVRSIEIARPPVIPVASPDFLARHPPIHCARDLLAHHLLHEESFDNWRTWLAHHGAAVDDAKLSGPRLWHGHLTVNAARRGLGIALANHFLAADDLASGRLVEVGDGQVFERISLGSYVFVARADRWNSPSVLRCRRWLTGLVHNEFGGRELELKSVSGAN